MLIKFDNFLQKIANWKTVLALFVISFPIGYYIEKPLFYKIGQLDYYYSYTANDIYSSISNFASAGALKNYINYQLTFQVFFPFVTALFFIIFIYHSGNNLVSKKILIPFALIVPTATLLIDYLENTGLLLLLLSYENSGHLSQLGTIAQLTSQIAPIKGFLWDVETLIFLAGIAIYLFKILMFVFNQFDVLEKFKKTAPTGKQNSLSE